MSTAEDSAILRWYHYKGNTAPVMYIQPGPKTRTLKIIQKPHYSLALNILCVT